MEAAFYTIIFTVWGIVLLKNILQWLYIWQTQEYRFDRFKVYLKEEFARHDENKFYITKLWLIFFLFNCLHGLFFVSFLIFYTGEFIWLVKDIFKKNIRRPVITVRIILCSLFSLILSVLFVLLFLFIRLNYLEQEIVVFTIVLYLIDILVPIIVSLSLLTTSPISLYLKRKTINKAKRKLASLNKMKIVGITGSFGKSSVKEILHTLLLPYCYIAKTRENINTKIGIADTIVHEVDEDTQVFIAEMGAYKEGEIASICKLTQPNIAVLTGISEQHVALFGSINNIVKAKFEIVDNMKEKSVAILNIDDKRIRKRIKKIKKKVITFGIDKKEADLRAVNFSVKRSRIKFDLIYKGKKNNLIVRLPGKHNVYNVLAAVAVALTLKIPFKDIKQSIEKIKPIDKKLNSFKGKNGALVIDDSYNSNPKGFEAALEYLSLFKGKKILITSGFRELGRDKIGVYKSLKELIKKYADMVLTFDKDLEKVLKDLMGDRVLYMKNADDLIAQYGSIVEDGTSQRESETNKVVLLEGRLPVKVARYFRV